MASEVKAEEAETDVVNNRRVTQRGKFDDARSFIQSSDEGCGFHLCNGLDVFKKVKEDIFRDRRQHVETRLENRIGSPEENIF